jgi:hypothetical protein
MALVRLHHNTRDGLGPSSLAHEVPMTAACRKDVCAMVAKLNEFATKDAGLGVPISVSQSRYCDVRRGGGGFSRPAVPASEIFFVLVNIR